MRVGPGRNMRGFTLIELVVTMVVLAILVMAAQPSLRDFFDRYRLRGAVDDVVSLISNARAAAVKEDRDVSVSMGGGTSAWCVGANSEVDPTPGQPANASAVTCSCTNTAQCIVSGGRLAIDVGKHPGVSVDAVTESFVFNSKLGLIAPLASHSVTFTSKSGKYDIAVGVNPLGQASACVPSGKPGVAGVAACP